jgi:hypothetical protein
MIDSPELAGLGAALNIRNDITDEILMNVLKLKISAPDEFLPIIDVITRVSDGGLGIRICICIYMFLHIYGYVCICICIFILYV